MEENKLIINRTWAMPNKHTFLIKPIKELLDRFAPFDKWFDPFCGFNSPAGLRNDLNPEIEHAQFHLPADVFCSQLEDDKHDGCLFDPPYNLNQTKECYKSIGLKLNQGDALYFPTNVKNVAAKKVKIGGYVISFGWDTIGFGKKRGYELLEVLDICHGGKHYDTLITIEKRII